MTRHLHPVMKNIKKTLHLSLTLKCKTHGWFQWNNIILQQQTVAQQYYLMQSQNPSLWGGSVSGHAVINCGREAGATLLRNDYFSENSRFESKFRRWFRMSRDLFLRIRRGLKQHSSMWKTTYNAARTPGLSSYQKMCAFIQFLAYGTAADLFDQYFRIGESTLLDYVKHFCRDIVTVFGPTYLRKPNTEDIERLLQVAEARGFLRMLGSLDCMYYEWKNCPTANAGAYHGEKQRMHYDTRGGRVI